MPDGGGLRLNPDLTPEEFHLFRDYIQGHSGIFLEDDKLDSLRISLVARTTFLGCATYEDYFRILSADEREFGELMNLITINETSFFRFPQQFEVLKEQVLPEILANQKRVPHALRLWSAGCSTGEEPYSIAITVDRFLKQAGRDVAVQILGTDVSQKALRTAQRAEYGQRTMMNVPPDVLAEYFDRVGERYRVKESIRRLVEFGYHNLIKEPYPLSMVGTWDVIFCRNVTIYFKLESTKRVVSNFYRALVDGGYLFIGHSETLQMISDEFTAVQLGNVFLYKKYKKVTEPPRTFRFLSSLPKIEAKERPEVGSEPRPEGEQEDLARAEALVRERRFDDALSLVDDVLEGDANNARAHLLKGFIYADAGRYDDAMAECQKAIAIDPLLAAARYVSGVIKMQRRDFTGAVSDLRRATYIDHDFALAYFRLASILRSQGDSRGARTAFKATLAAIRSQPQGEWTEFLGGFAPELVVQTCERGLAELAAVGEGEKKGA